METSGGPQPHDARIMVWAPPRSLAATYGIDFSFFSSRYLDVSVPGLTFHALWIGAWMHEVSSCGFPHSEIRGSLIMCISPRLFAAYHVFLRPKVPRHPPRVLVRLTFSLRSPVCSDTYRIFACSRLAFAQDNRFAFDLEDLSSFSLLHNRLLCFLLRCLFPVKH